jgi:hypothetical protein
VDRSWNLRGAVVLLLAVLAVPMMGQKPQGNTNWPSFQGDCIK